jgi:glycosyltransferase involved in cell wall biosynthesis
VTPLDVSVIVPCRNAAPFLAATLASLLGQTHRAAEIVVVDDGSTDGSRAIAARHAPDVVVLTSPGRGASAARNAGMAHARGRFVQFLDADDFVEPHALRSRVDALEQSGADVAISDWERLERRGESWHPVRTESGALPTVADPADLVVFRGFWAPPAAILYRRSICDRVGAWRENLPVIQDARFLFDAAHAGARFVHVAGVGAKYRQHAGGSLASADPFRFWTDVLENTIDVERIWRRAGRLDAPHLEAIGSAFELVTRVGFVSDRRLFERGRGELRRFGHAETRLVRAALLLSRLAGYPLARSILAPFCR